MNKKIVVNSPHAIEPSALGADGFSGWCLGCGQAVEMVAFRQAARIAQIGLDDLILVAARGELHLGVRPEALLICLNSLLECDLNFVKSSVFLDSVPQPLAERNASNALSAQSNG